MAALALLACGGDATGPAGTPREALLALARRDTVPPPGQVTFQVRNDRLTTHTVTFSDAVQTTLFEFNFVARSIVSTCDTCTVTVAVTTTPGAFGFTLGPAGLVFRLSSPPTVRISYARYADYAVRDSSGRYADDAAFAAALDIWRERAAGRWSIAGGSAPSGATALAAGLDRPGTYLVAAPK